MKMLMIAAATLALAVPASAQQSGSQQRGSTSAQTTDQRGSITAMSQNKLRQSLQQAGFKDINIVDAAYVVHARTSDGQMVVMYIDPPSATTGAAQGGSGSSGTTGAAGSVGSTGASDQNRTQQPK